MSGTVLAEPKRLRTCVGCGKQSSKGDFLRIVRLADGEAAFDASGKQAGRGAYVCSKECFDAVCKKQKLERALKMNLSEQDYVRIGAQIAAYDSENVRQ